MNLIDADRLKAVIEEWYNAYKIGSHSVFRSGKIEALRETIELIDSLQQEQPSLNDAAFDYAELCKYDGVDKLLCAEHFKAGAEWMAEQGEILEGEVVKDINNRLGVSAKGLSRAKTKFGDRVIVQIRKK